MVKLNYVSERKKKINCVILFIYIFLGKTNELTHINILGVAWGPGLEIYCKVVIKKFWG